MPSWTAGAHATRRTSSASSTGSLAADGYEPTAADIDLKSLCESALAHNEDEEE